VVIEFLLKLGQKLLKEYKQDKLILTCLFKNIMVEENNEQEYLVLQQQLRNVVLQKEALKIQVNEIESALEELKKTEEETVYKVVGNVMVKKKKDEVEKELNEIKEDSELKISSLENFEKDLIERIKGIEGKLKSKGG
jgi:prefoldin beta subunit